MQKELPLFVHWEKVLGDVLDRTARFPKAARFTFSTRIDNTCLDILEKIVEARYSKSEEKEVLLKEADRALARLRVLLRVSYDRQYLSHGGFEHLMREIDEAGRMIGGWRRDQAERAR